jgi:hypothetical protein
MHNAGVNTVCAVLPQYECQQMSLAQMIISEGCRQAIRQFTSCAAEHNLPASLATVLLTFRHQTTARPLGLLVPDMPL